MKAKTRPAFEELQAAVTTLHQAGLLAEGMFHTCTAFPNAHQVSRMYIRLANTMRSLREAMELEVERYVREGKVCEDDCWWMVHPSARPLEFKCQEQPGIVNDWGVEDSAVRDADLEVMRQRRNFVG